MESVDRTATAELPSNGLCAAVGQAASDEIGQASLLRWIAAVFIGVLVGFPLGILLSYAASLPYFLGLFFFALFGLMISALTYRVAGGGRPLSRRAVVSGTAILVLWPLAVSIIKEASDVPENVAEAASRNVRTIGDRTAAEFRADIESQFRRWLSERYPPGGTVGYIRWITTSGVLPKGELPVIPRDFERPCTKIVWIVRVILSAVLLTFGVYSQTGQRAIRIEVVS